MTSALPESPAQLTPPPASGNLDGGALAVTPAGSNGEYGLPPELVRTVERGSGCRVWDTNGREYLDYTMAWGSVLTGHAHPRVVEAITEAARCGINYAAVNRRSVALAERLIAQCPCVEHERAGGRRVGPRARALRGLRHRIDLHVSAHRPRGHGAAQGPQV